MADDPGVSKQGGPDAEEIKAGRLGYVDSTVLRVAKGSDARRESSRYDKIGFDAASLGSRELLSTPLNFEFIVLDPSLKKSAQSTEALRRNDGEFAAGEPWGVGVVAESC